MVHILTLHFATNAWLEIQKRHILKYTNKEDYKLWIGKYHNEFPADFELPDNWETIDLDEIYPKDIPSEHYHQAQWMFNNRIKENMDDDDFIVFLDSDAFPCDPVWISYMKSAFAERAEGAMSAFCVVQYENRGIVQPDEYYPYPDLCFFATTKKTWDENNLEWGLFRHDHQNPGFGMQDRLAAANLKVAVISRTNAFNAHNVMFGVYGNIIYHHQCGSRAIIGRPIGSAENPANVSRQCYTGQDLFGRQDLGPKAMTSFEEDCQDIIETNTQIFDIIYDKLQKDVDCNFIRRYFMGKP